MKTTEDKSGTDLEPPLIPEKLHPTVEAFIQKKLDMARESLKNVDLSFLQKNREPVK